MQKYSKRYAPTGMEADLMLFPRTKLPKKLHKATYNAHKLHHCTIRRIIGDNSI